MGSVYYQPQGEVEAGEADSDEDEDEDEFLEAWEEEGQDEEAFQDVSESRVFALGLVLREFTVESAGDDEEAGAEGEEDEGDDQPPSGVAAALVRKRATATALAVYCDPHCLPLVVYQTHAHPAALVGGAGPPSPSRSTAAAPAGPSPEDHNYLLLPTSGALSLATRPVPLSATKPQYDVACRLSRVHVAVTRPQVDRLASVAAVFSAFSQWDPEQQRLWRLRPKKSALEEPRAWWRYATEVRWRLMD